MSILLKTPECNLHPGGKLCFFCKNDKCNAKLCQFCVEQNHKSHSVIDLIQFASEFKEKLWKQTNEKMNLQSDFRSMLNELEQMEKRNSEKFSKLFSDEKRVEEQFEQRSRKWLKIIKDRNTKLSAHVIKLKGILENAKETLKLENLKLNPNDNITEWGDDEIRKILGMKIEGTSIPKTEIQLLFSKVQQEMSSYEELNINTIKDEIYVNSKGVLLLSDQKLAQSYYATQSSKTTKNSLKITIPETPSDMQNLSTAPLLSVKSEIPNSLTPTGSRISPDKACENLSNQLDMQISVKKAELKRLEKTKERLLKANREIQMQIEKQNRILVTNIEPIITKSATPKGSPQDKEGQTSPTIDMKKIKLSQQNETLMNRLKIAENALETIIKQHGMELEKYTLETMITKVGKICEEYNEINTKLKLAEDKKKHTKKQSTSISPNKYKKEVEKLVHEKSELEENIAALKKEVSLNRSIVKTHKAAYEKEKELVQSLEQEKDKLQRELKITQDQAKRIKITLNKRIMELTAKNAHTENTEILLDSPDKIPVMNTDKLNECKENIKNIKEKIKNITQTYSTEIKNVKGIMEALSVFAVSNRDAFKKCEKNQSNINISEIKSDLYGKIKEIIKKKYNEHTNLIIHKITENIEEKMKLFNQKIIKNKENIGKIFINFNEILKNKNTEILNAKTENENSTTKILNEENEKLKQTNKISENNLLEKSNKIDSLNIEIQKLISENNLLKSSLENTNKSNSEQISLIRKNHKENIIKYSNLLRNLQIQINQLKSEILSIFKNFLQNTQKYDSFANLIKEKHILILQNLSIKYKNQNIAENSQIIQENLNLKSEIKKFNEIQVELTSKIANLTNILESKEKELNSQQKTISDQTEALNIKINENKKLDAIIQVKDQELLELQNDVKRTFSESEEYMKMIEVLNNKDAQLENNETQINQMVAHIQNIELENSELKGKLEEIAKKENEKTGQESQKIDEVENRNEELMKEYDNTKTELETLRTEYMELNEKYLQLVQK